MKRQLNTWLATEIYYMSTILTLKYKLQSSKPVCSLPQVEVSCSSVPEAVGSVVEAVGSPSAAAQSVTVGID